MADIDGKARRILLTFGWILVVSSAVPVFSGTCPFCSAVKQTIRQEMESMDVVAIGTLLPDGRTEGSSSDGRAHFRIVSVLRGSEVVQPDEVHEVIYFGSAKPGTQFMMMAVDPSQPQWSSPLPLTARAEEYILAVSKLAEDPLERLKFFQQYFEDEESLMARDAYDEFALAPYEEVKLLKPHLNRENLLKWISDDDLDPNRKRLYFTLLAICGVQEDAETLEAMLKSESTNRRAGLDALIAAYLTLKGDSGFSLVDDLFLKNASSTYADTYAAIMALRFHGTEGGIFTTEQILPSLRHVLARPELADLVIPDLARWKDWSQIDRLVELFKTADTNNSWVRTPVVNYLRSCPLPEAAERLKELEEIDPKAVQRAKTFFPIPVGSSQGGKETSQVIPAEYTQPIAMADSKRREDRVVASRIRSSIASSASNSTFGSVVNPQSKLLNRWYLGSVFVLAWGTLALVIWMILVGKSRVAAHVQHQR